jgi:hypothetical protein
MGVLMTKADEDAIREIELQWRGPDMTRRV